MTRYFCLQGSQYLQIPDKIFEMFLPLMQIFGKNKTKQKQIQEEEKRLKKKKKHLSDKRFSSFSYDLLSLTQKLDRIIFVIF